MPLNKSIGLHFKCVGDVLANGTVAKGKQIFVDKCSNVVYHYGTKVSPYNPQEIVSSMCYCRNKALIERHPSYGMLFRFI